MPSNEVKGPLSLRQPPQGGFHAWTFTPRRSDDPVVADWLADYSLPNNAVHD